MPADISRADQLDWIQLRKDMDEIMPAETMLEKAKRKFSASPLIPIGAAATVAALTIGIRSFLKGKSQMSQYMMRARVVAQGCTIVAVLYSLSATIPKQK